MLFTRGEWRRARYTGEEHARIVLCCPLCLRECSLGPDHRVTEDGTITPAVVCPYKGCPFDEVIQLDGWDAELTPVERTDDLPGPPPEAWVT